MSWRNRPGRFKVYDVRGKDGLLRRKAYRIDDRGRYISKEPPKNYAKRFVGMVLAQNPISAVIAFEDEPVRLACTQSPSK